MLVGTGDWVGAPERQMGTLRTAGSYPAFPLDIWMSLDVVEGSRKIHAGTHFRHDVEDYGSPGCDGGETPSLVGEGGG